MTLTAAEIGIWPGTTGLAIGGEYLLWTADDDSVAPLLWSDGAGDLRIMTWVTTAPPTPDEDQPKVAPQLIPILFGA
ncbi:hypothetical protein [Amaricoccus solimangrovi]|uniref:Uncharacterized protein n=1 Tax=Amaricoccus solimangrovi TaxID=2589815 RepID=A0A501W7Q9_9RHOB|nr:hypothetical protein [Amaricoccus solimangrovi]TPE44124.1 hypothetical protein FJM51_23180 [Amaricoccus solimangrovi]